VARSEIALMWATTSSSNVASEGICYSFFKKKKKVTFFYNSHLLKTCKHLINSDGTIFLASRIAKHVLSSDEVQEITFVTAVVSSECS